MYVLASIGIFSSLCCVLDKTYIYELYVKNVLVQVLKVLPRQNSNYHNIFKQLKKFLKKFSNRACSCQRVRWVLKTLKSTFLLFFPIIPQHCTSILWIFFNLLSKVIIFFCIYKRCLNVNYNLFKFFSIEIIL